ncbi:protein OCTOPUS-like [Solanum stenotomum]|uniref:protein OCTOPUS-like n=1 Tax=Solanum stenotomum TaxID=172797 RepID=UPI0020D15987|nr:protein OCTOPUS-like [Solanum stenotomum]
MTRTTSQNRTRTRTRRLSACYRHPSEPVTGICAACLRERLSGLDSSADSELSIVPTFSNSFENPDADNGPEPGPGFDGSRSKAATSSFSPDLRRCRSVSTARCEGSCSWSEPRRRSCDDRSSRNTLVNLFGVDDEVGGPNAGFNVESKNLGLTNLSDNVCQSIVEHKESEEVRVRADALVRIEDIDEDTQDGELKTMKEFIDLEFHTKNQKSRDFRDIAVNFREATSVFSKKLQKWRQKQREKKLNSRNAEGNDRFSAGNSKLIGYKSKDSRSEIGECAMGRRSCDTEPRFSVDAGRLSLDGPGISIDEPRASWDGYMVARTIPRLTPMLSVVENVLLGNGNGFDRHRASLDGQMQAIVEDESSSGGSGQSNSDSSSSQRGSSFDRSSSVQSFGKRTLDLEVNEGKYMSNSSSAHVKLVITERELKDWRLNSIKDDNLNKYESFPKNGIVAESCDPKKGSKKPARWREVFNLFGNKQKLNNNKGETRKGEGETISSVTDSNGKQGDKGYDNVKEAAQWRLSRSSSIVGARKSCSSSYIPARNSCSSAFDQPRNSCDMTELNYSKKKVAERAASANFGRDAFVLERNRSVKCSSNDIDNGTLPFYLMPLRTSRSRRFTENKLTKPLHATGKGLH